jgi:ketosteroid isomerase-like protein
MFGLERLASNRIRFIALLGAAIFLLQTPRPVHAETTQKTLLDRIQIEDLMYNYYTDLMSEQSHDVGKYYVEDGVLQANELVLKGRDTIRKFFETAKDPRYVEGAKYNMLLNNPRINVTGDTATFDAVWTGVISDNVKSTPRFIEQGTEHSEWVKQNGHWLITKRAITSQGGMPDALADK